MQLAPPVRSGNDFRFATRAASVATIDRHPAAGRRRNRVFRLPTCCHLWAWQGLRPELHGKIQSASHWQSQWHTAGDRGFERVRAMINQGVHYRRGCLGFVLKTQQESRGRVLSTKHQPPVVFRPEGTRRDSPGQSDEGASLRCAALGRRISQRIALKGQGGVARSRLALSGRWTSVPSDPGRRALSLRDADSREALNNPDKLEGA